MLSAQIADPANWGAVTIVSTDMRVWGEKNKDKKADILVSELLGSFGEQSQSSNRVIMQTYKHPDSQ
eukprot:SAG31_NODE_505_length_14757_cov_20.172943_8_plen_67_part_00